MVPPVPFRISPTGAEMKAVPAVVCTVLRERLPAVSVTYVFVPLEEVRFPEAWMAKATARPPRATLMAPLSAWRSMLSPIATGSYAARGVIEVDRRP